LELGAILMASSSTVAGIAAAAAQAVLQVLLVASAGVFLRLQKAGRATISDIAYRVLLPALMFVNVAEVVSFESLRRLFVVPLGAVCLISVGAGLGLLVAPCVGLGRSNRTRDDFTRIHFLLSSMIGNHGYLPLILVPATILQGALHPGMDMPGLIAQTKLGVSYIALYILIINVFTWSFAAMLLRGVAEERAAAEVKAEAAKEARQGRKGGERSAEEAGTAPLAPRVHDPDAGRSKSFLAYRARAIAWGLPAPVSLAGTADFVTGVVTPPVLATFCGFLIGLVPPLKALLFVPNAAPTALDGGIGLAARRGVAAAAVAPLPALLTASLGVSASAVAAALHACAVAASVPPSLPLGGPIANAAVAAAGLAISRDGVGWKLCGHGPVRPLDWPTFSAGNATALALAPCCIGLGRAILEAAIPGVAAAAAAVAPPATVVPTPVVTALFGPTLTAALQSFASAIVPLVALNLGSHIVAGDEASGKGAAAALPGSRWSLAAAVAWLQGEMRDDVPPATAGGEPSVGVKPIIRMPVLLAVTAIRLLLMPMAGIAYAVLVSRTGLAPSNDPTLLFVLMLEASTPPAMNLQLIADIMGSGARSTARVIGFTYIVSVLTLTGWLSVFIAALRSGWIEGRT